MLEVVLDVAMQRVDLESVLLTNTFVGPTDPRPDIRLGLDHLVEMQTRLPLHDETQGAVRQLEHLVDVGRRANRIQILLRRLLGARLDLGKHPDNPAVGDRLLDQADGTLASHRQRHEGIRKQDGVAQWQHRQLGWDRDRPLNARELLVEELVLIAHRATLLADSQLVVKVRLHSTGGASRLAGLPSVFPLVPVFFLVAPCHTGAASLRSGLSATPDVHHGLAAV